MKWLKEILEFWKLKIDLDLSEEDLYNERSLNTAKWRKQCRDARSGGNQNGLNAITENGGEDDD